MRKRWIVGGVLVVLLGVSGTGLAVNQTFLAGRWSASRASAQLATSLRDVDGVASATAEYDPLGLPDATLAVRVTFDADAPTRSWGRASTEIRSAAAAADLRTVTPTASFRQSGSDTRADVEPLLFSPGTVATEVAAWRALRTTFGDRISLHLGRASGYSDGTGPLTREYRVRSAADMRRIAAAWPAESPTVDPALPTSWSGPGLQLRGMPTASEMAAVHALGDVMPLAPTAAPGAGATGTYGVVLGNVRGFQVEILTLRDGKPATAAPDATLVEGTRVALATGAAQVDWVSARGMPSIVVGECGTVQVGGRTVTTTFSTTREDTRFAATLTAAGLELPAGVRGGVCT